MPDLDQTLERLDPETVRRVAPVLAWLLGPPGDRRPLGTLQQLDVQRLLWRDLPLHWATSRAEHHELAWALADVFEALGRDRYAALCRDPRTHEVLAAWHRDGALGARLADEAEAAAGVLPPPTSLLAFGAVRGPVEERVHRTASAVLEDGIATGALDPSLRGFRVAAQRRVERYVGAPDPALDGEEPVRAVWRERSAHWRTSFAGVPRGFWDRVMPAVHSTPPVPDRVALSVAPAVALLGVVGDALDLDDDARLPTAAVRALDERFGWSQRYSLPAPWRETDLQPLLLVDEHLRRQRLLTRRGSRLSVSVAGRRAAGDPAALWSALVAPVPRWQDGVEHDALAVLAAAVLGQERHTADSVVAAATAVLAGKWEPTAGASLREAVASVWSGWYRLGIPLGWWEERRGPVRPTHYGRAANASVFRAVSTRPRLR